METYNDRQLENFAHNVTWLRQYYGISKKRMAQLLKISINSLTRLESGEVPPKMSALILLHVYKHFGIRPSDQFGSRLGD